MEKWKDIKDYEGLYQVSNLGRVKSLNYLRTGKEKILKSIKDNKGYLSVAFSKEGKYKRFLVHRLVAQAFLDNPNNLPEVNHKDENKTNNQLTNLEWCDRKYNMNYGTRIERIQKPILQFTKQGEFVRRWYSIIQAERELGFNKGNISICCNGQRKTAKGYVWGYEKDYERIPFKVFDLEIYKKSVNKQ